MTGPIPYDENEPQTAGMIRWCEDGHDGPGDYVLSSWAGWIKCEIGVDQDTTQKPDVEIVA